MILLSVFIILSIGFIVLLVTYTFKSVRASRLAVSSTIGLSDTERAMEKWHEDNPYGSIYDPDFQELLQSHIGAYLIWGLYHPYCKDDGYLDRLDSAVV